MLIKYLHLLNEKCPDFKKVNRKYLTLKKKLQQRFAYTDKLTEIYENKLICEMRFSFEQGYEDNLMHFKNPHKKTFLDMEYDDTFKKMFRDEDYKNADNDIAKLVKLMTDEVKIIYLDMLEYYTFLEVYIPKMSHYHGYITANETLPKTLPRYSEDKELNSRYTRWLSTYLNFDLKFE